MSQFLLQELNSKEDIDNVIRFTEEKVVILRFGRVTDMPCMQLDHILSKAEPHLRKMAIIRTIEVDLVPEYVSYFDISIIPSTLFFFNAQHIKVDYGSPDHTKFVGPFQTKQDVIDLVEVIYRGAMRGKLIVQCPIDPSHIPKYDLLYQGF